MMSSSKRGRAVALDLRVAAFPGLSLWLTLLLCVAVTLIALGLADPARSALTVPTDIQQPGTQPGEVGALETPDKCDNCHGTRSKGVELAHEWKGSMMSHATRDPIFWATVAISEQDFDGSGDLCLRCHTTAGWLAGRSTPTDGSGLQSGDTDGVDCDYCHTLTNPDDSEHLGEQFGDFIANDGGSPAAGYYGSVAFLADEGDNMLEAWVNTGMSEPYTMASVDIIAVPEAAGLSMLTAGVAFLATIERRGARR
jgi:hypothetical protein